MMTQKELNTYYFRGMVKELKRRGYSKKEIRKILAYDNIIKRAEHGDGDVLYHYPPERWVDFVEGGWLYSQGIDPCEKRSSTRAAG